MFTWAYITCNERLDVSWMGEIGQPNHSLLNDFKTTLLISVFMFASKFLSCSHIMIKLLTIVKLYI